MDEQETVSIRFPDLELGDAGQAARILREAILDEAPGVEVEIQKDDETTMDFGATLVVVLGTPAVLAVARGIAKWIARERAVIEIKGGEGTMQIRVEGTVDENVARILEAIGKR
jgi:hypothetical protein